MTAAPRKIQQLVDLVISESSTLKHMRLAQEVRTALKIEAKIGLTWEEVGHRHITHVEIDLESVRRGGSCRTASCLCGWTGPQRGTMELATDDALTHERSKR